MTSSPNELPDFDRLWDYNQPAETERRFRALLTDLDRAGETDGHVHEEFAECLLALGRDREARPHFALAYAALSQDPWLVEHEPSRLERLNALGQV